MPSRDITKLDLRFQPMVSELLSKGQPANGWILFITDGLRTMQEQTDLYAQGRTKPGKIVTNAKAGESAHNYGMAVDLAFQRNGVLSYDASLYRPVYDLARKLGFFLGADWTSFKDYPHFEYPNWEKAKDQPMANTYSEADMAAVRADRDRNWNLGVAMCTLLGIEMSTDLPQLQNRVLDTVRMMHDKSFLEGIASVPLQPAQSIEQLLKLPDNLYVTGTIVSRK